MPSSPETCPNCGADVPRGAKACPACGSDESTGWSDEARYGGLDLPDDQFDYDDFAKREFGDAGCPSPPRGVSWFWWAVAVTLIIGFLAVFVF
ncbi:MAG TPA: zinc ribbon domain-containing protein [Verrucomicrobiae bacterium]